MFPFEKCQVSIAQDSDQITHIPSYFIAKYILLVYYTYLNIPIIKV